MIISVYIYIYIYMYNVYMTGLPKPALARACHTALASVAPPGGPRGSPFCRALIFVCIGIVIYISLSLYIYIYMYICTYILIIITMIILLTLITIPTTTTATTTTMMIMMINITIMILILMMMIIIVMIILITIPTTTLIMITIKECHGRAWRASQTSRGAAARRAGRDCNILLIFVYIYIYIYIERYVYTYTHTLYMYDYYMYCSCVNKYIYIYIYVYANPVRARNFRQPSRADPFSPRLPRAFRTFLPDGPIHPIPKARSPHPRFCSRGIRTLSALRISKGWVRKDPNLGWGIGCRQA